MAVISKVPVKSGIFTGIRESSYSQVSIFREFAHKKNTPELMPGRFC